MSRRAAAAGRRSGAADAGDGDRRRRRSVGRCRDRGRRGAPRPATAVGGRGDDRWARTLPDRGSPARHVSGDRARRRVRRRADDRRGAAARRKGRHARHRRRRPRRSGHRHGDTRRGAARDATDAAGQRHHRLRASDAIESGRGAGGGRGGGPARAAYQRVDGRHLRARSHGQQGQRLRGRRPLLDRRAARRRQHVLRPDRSGDARQHRNPARPEQRRVRQRRPRREHPVPLARARHRRRRRSPVRRRVFRRRQLGGSSARAAACRFPTQDRESACSPPGLDAASATCARAAASTRTPRSRASSACARTA